jgi:hypothetical protein
MSRLQFFDFHSFINAPKSDESHHYSIFFSFFYTAQQRKRSEIKRSKLTALFFIPHLFDFFRVLRLAVINALNSNSGELIGSNATVKPVRRAENQRKQNKNVNYQLSVVRECETEIDN